jgi:hypothetical protein
MAKDALGETSIEAAVRPRSRPFRTFGYVAPKPAVGYAARPTTNRSPRR